MRGSVIFLAAVALVVTAIAWGIPSVLEASGNVEDASATDELTAREIVDGATEAYAGCETYLDTGVVTTVYHTAEGDKTDAQFFSLAFIRGCCLSFEFMGEDGDLEAWRGQMLDTDASTARTWRDTSPGEEQTQTLLRSLAWAIGSTGGCGGVVLAMLVPEHLPGGSLSDLTELSRLDDDDMDGVECLRVRGNTESGRPMTAWIHPRSFIVRRLQVAHELPGYFGRPGFSTETTMDFVPELNVKIELGDLESSLGQK